MQALDSEFEQLIVFSTQKKSNEWPRIKDICKISIRIGIVYLENIFR